MNTEWLAASGLAVVKPLLAALVLPPASLLAIVLAGLWIGRTRPRVGRTLSALGCLGIWLCCCNGPASWVEHAWLAEPAALGQPGRARLKAQAASGESTAIVVLGGGVDRSAPEYGAASLGVIPLARLRYGVWLARATGVPLGASGGLGWGAAGGQVAEADVMAATARTEFGLPLSWIEATSRDTRENAMNTLRLLRPAGVRRIVVVTNGWHMPRAVRDFRAAVAATGEPAIEIVAAPMGQAYPGDLPVLDWIPSGDGAQRMRAVLREVLATLVDGRG